MSGLFCSPGKMVGSHVLYREGVPILLGWFPLDSILRLEWLSSGRWLWLVQHPICGGLRGGVVRAAHIVHHPVSVALCLLGWLLQRQQGVPRKGVEGGP